MPDDFDLIWVDKAVFLNPETVSQLRAKTQRLVHYTPDCAFHANRSHLFEQTGQQFDLLVTTKSFEQETYRTHFPETELRWVSQGYQAGVHRVETSFEDKSDIVAFVGLAESDRFAAAEALLGEGIPLKIAGKGWERFVSQHDRNPAFSFAGAFLAGEDYVRFLSSAKFGLGLLSKRFPELHTTRTFEIPACGTALVTERNRETTQFFREGEAIFFDSFGEMVRKIQSLRLDSEQLQSVSEKGQRRVERDGRSYEAILGDILQSLGLR